MLTVSIPPEPSHPILMAGDFSQVDVRYNLNFGVSLNRDMQEVYYTSSSGPYQQPTTPSI